MIAHHQHWLLAFTALLSRSGSRQARTLMCVRIGDTHRRPSKCWTCLRTLPEVVVSIGPFRGSQAGGGAKDDATATP